MSVLSRIKSNKVVKYLSVAVVSAIIACMGVIGCFAADGSSGSNAQITSALSSAFDTMKSDIFSYIVIILPIALAVVGAFFGIKKAINFFRSTASK